MKFTFPTATKVAFSALMLGVTMNSCSPSDDGDMRPDPDPIGGDPDPVVGPVNDIKADLYIANLTGATPSDRLAITKGRKTTVHGNDLYRNTLGLSANKMIYSISGGSYNTDGSTPKTEKNSFTAYDSNDMNRNNTSISFVFADEASANADLIINTAVTFGATSQIITAENNSTRSIEQGSLTIKAKEARLEDAITPLGKDKDGNVLTSFKFNDIDVTDYKFNGLKYGPSAVADNNNNPIDITHSDLVTMFGTQGNTIPIKIIETAVVQDGQRLPVVQPLNF